MSEDTNINIKLAVDDLNYDVEITHIGDFEDDEETGGGIIPIEYNAVPEPESDKDREHLHDAINKYMENAIKGMIEIEKEKIEKDSE